MEAFLFVTFLETLLEKKHTFPYEGVSVVKQK